MKNEEKMKPEKLNIGIKKRYLILIILVLLILFPYIKVEIHTFLFGGQFRNLYDTSGWIENDQWELESWECLWSRSGNAEKFFYPYYPHW